MAVATIVTLAVLASKHLAVAAPSPSYANPRCVDLMLPISASTDDNKVFDIVHPDDNINATACAVDLDTFGAPSIPERVIRNITVSGTWNVAAHLCVPEHGSKKDHLQIASHGAIYDSRYWDVRVNPSEHSWVDNFLDAGYSLLTYDRIGTGKSDKPDAYTVVQTPLEVEILRGVTELAQSGQLMKHAIHGAQAKETKFNKFIHVGHSQGSAITLNFLTAHGELSDGAIITGQFPTTKRSGFSFASLNVQYAAQSNPTLFGEFGKGYVVPTTGGVQTGFLSTKRNYTVGLGGFTQELYEYSDAIKQPMAITELLAQIVLGDNPAPKFVAPLQFVVGEFDFLVCESDCRGAVQPALMKELYSNATDIDFYMQSGTGHGLPFHLGAKVGFQVTLKWLEKVGL